MSAPTCYACDEPVLEGEQDPALKNAAIHRECYFRVVVGSVGHQMGKCTCYGGTMDDPPGLTKREAARAAWDHFRHHARLAVENGHPDDVTPENE